MSAITDSTAAAAPTGSNTRAVSPELLAATSKAAKYFLAFGSLDLSTKKDAEALKNLRNGFRSFSNPGDDGRIDQLSAKVQRKISDLIDKCRTDHPKVYQQVFAKV
jgi:hypothetical protein